jgi:hypothetical protein
MMFAAAAISAIASGISSVGSALGIGGGAAAAAGAAGAGNFIGAGLGAAGSVSTVGAGAGLGATLAGAGSLLSSILSGTATVAGMMGAQASAEESARTLTAQAMDARSEQDIERLRGGERRDSLRRALLQTLGERDVAAAASGVDLSFGTPAIARDEAERDAERALATDRSTEDLRVARLQERESEFLRAASSTKRAGRLKAFGLGAQGVASATRRYA